MKKMNYFNLLKKIWVVPALLLMASCDLDIEGTDSVIVESGEGGTFGGVADVQSSVNDLYNSLYSQLESQENFFALNEVTTEEFLVPTRGTDWGDNGIWRTLHAHTWGPSHLYILNVWNGFNQNVFRASQVIDSRSMNGRTDELIAQAKFLRAFSMWVILDHYGVAPFRGVDDGPEVAPGVLTRAEAMQFVMTDLNEAIPDLPTRGPSAENNRASKSAARMLLAKVLLNAHIYDGTGSPSSTNMQAVVDLVDDIAADGFALQGGYFELFESSVDNETIWYANASVGNRIWNGLHYNMNAPGQNDGGGWNGFSTLAEFYDLFEGDPNVNVPGSGQEERRGFVATAAEASEDNLGMGIGFLIGQQYESDGSPLTDRPGSPLVFTKDLPALTGNNERNGIRVLKYHPKNGAFESHEIIFRYADAHLMKAEAMMRMGGDPTTMVNELRTLREASAIAAVSEQDLIDERGRELYMEFWRRNDLVRFGQFTKNWEFKDPISVDDANRNLFPIPIDALLSNPNLTQNPGY